MSIRSLILFAALLAPTSRSQSPSYLVPPAARIASTVQTTLQHKPILPFATFLDARGGPVRVAGETFYLGFTPLLSLLDAGTLDAAGARQASFAIPNSAELAGLAIYTQAIVFDAAASNGRFAASNGQSFGIHAARAVIAEDFTQAATRGYTGTFETNAIGRLQGAARTRTKSTRDPQGVFFGQGVTGAFNPYGARQQLVFRAKDLGAIGEEELVTAIRWRPFGRRVYQETYTSMDIHLAHSLVVPDYTIDRMSLLPMFPFSGLAKLLAANFKAGDPIGLVRVATGPYIIHPGLLRPDGYLDFSITQHFPYNGIDSLVMDFATSPSQLAFSQNGQEVYLMVTSAPEPYCRMSVFGSAARPLPTPHLLTMGETGDNALPDYQFELVQVKTFALSPFLASPHANPDYGPPIIADAVPLGTSYTIEYRGSRDGTAGNATAWSPSIDVADGLSFVQFRVRFSANLNTREAPSLDTLVIPVN